MPRARRRPQHLVERSEMGNFLVDLELIGGPIGVLASDVERAIEWRARRERLINEQESADPVRARGPTGPST